MVCAAAAAAADIIGPLPRSVARGNKRKGRGGGKRLRLASPCNHIWRGREPTTFRGKRGGGSEKWVNFLPFHTHSGGD